jgi:hypothetical protein
VDELSDRGHHFRGLAPAWLGSLAAAVLCISVAGTGVAQADNAMSLSGPKQYKSWLYESGKVGAVIAVRIADPRSRVAMVKWCLDFGGDKAGCKERSPKSLGWNSPGGWAGNITVKGGRLTIQSCQYIDDMKPKVALIVQAFDRDGVRVAQRRHVMTQTCNG